MEAIDLYEILDDEINTSRLLTESRHGIHLYNDGKMTFGEMKNIFNNVFSGGTTIQEAIDGLKLAITYRNGQFMIANNLASLKQPLPIDGLEKMYEGDSSNVRDAFKNSAKDITKALSSINSDDLKRFFNNGRNYLTMTVVYPPATRTIDYGNKCLIQLDGLNKYNKNFDNVGEDTESTERLYSILKNHNALRQELFEITEPNVLRIKNSQEAAKSLQSVLEQLDKLTDGVGYKCTISDYVKENIKKRIMNAAMKHDLDIDRNSDFVSEFADRISKVSGYRPTKTDLMTYAKKSGINVYEDNYRNLISEMDSTSDVINEEIMRPLEDMVINAGVLLMKNLTGYLATDPSKASQKLAMALENACNEIEHSEGGMTKDKIKRFQRNFSKIEQFQKDCIGSEGCLINHNGKIYRVNGAFGPISQILEMIRK